MKTNRKYFVARVVVAILGFSLFSGASAQAEDLYTLQNANGQLTAGATLVCSEEVCGPNGSFSTNPATMAQVSASYGCSPTPCTFVHVDNQTRQPITAEQEAPASPPVTSGASSGSTDTSTVLSSDTSETSTVPSAPQNSLSETPTPQSTPTPGASSAPVNGLAGVGGWAVIDSTGKVYGVIVCDNSVCGASGSWGGVMPVEYMGCPAGCRLVLQTSADPQTGNVAGWRSQEGTDVVYNEQTNTFSVQQSNQSTPTLIITPPTSTTLSFSTPVNQQARILDTMTATSETPTAINETSTVVNLGGIPIAPFSNSLALQPVLADVIPLESDGEEIEEPPAAEIGVRKEASGKFLISLDSNIYEDQLMVRAFKKGFKVIVFKVSTNIDGRAAIRTVRNLAGYKLAVYLDDQFLDSVRL